MNSVLGFLLLAFIVVPLLEIYVIIQVGSVIGGWETIGLLILVSLLGAFLVRREGFSILARIQGSLAAGELPTNPLVDGLLVLLAGALMLTPGFITDAVGLVLLIPPTRAIVRTLVKGRFAGRIRVAGATGRGASTGAGFTDVVWTDVTDDDDDPPSPPIELGPTTE